MLRLLHIKFMLFNVTGKVPRNSGDFTGLIDGMFLAYSIFRFLYIFDNGLRGRFFSCPSVCKKGLRKFMDIFGMLG